jgi:hypothetical protein
MHAPQLRIDLECNIKANNVFYQFLTFDVSQFTPFVSILRNQRIQPCVVVGV